MKSPVCLLLLLVTVCHGVEYKCESANEVDSAISLPKTSREKYADLKANIKAMKAACGQVCDTTMLGEDAPPKEEVGGVGTGYRVITKDIPCRELFENPLFDRKSEFDTPLAKIPKYLVEDFTYQGRVELRDDYRDNSGDSAAHWKVWDLELREKHFSRYEEGRLVGSYGQDNVEYIVKTLKDMNIDNHHVLIIGSERPWLETSIIKAGAKHVTTLDYVKIDNHWPEVTTMTPDVFGEMYLNGTLPKFDSMVTFSSVEHSGMGRYGDALNPFGDLIAMARAWCVMAPGTKALVGVPSGGPDRIHYNSAKLYSDIQYSHLFANWKVVHSDVDPTVYDDKCYHCYQPLIVVERK